MHISLSECALMPSELLWFTGTFPYPGFFFYYKKKSLWVCTFDTVNKGLLVCSSQVETLGGAVATERKIEKKKENKEGERFFLKNKRLFLAVCVKDDIWRWYHPMYLNSVLVWQLGSYVLLMGWSLWPERVRQLEILVDWQPRDQRNLLMCLSRNIYNWFLELCSRHRRTDRHVAGVCACCCYDQTVFFW